MIIQRIVVFSGFDSRVVERARASLRSRQIDVVFVKLIEPIGVAYFESLMERTHLVIESYTRMDVRVVAVVASCITDAHVLPLEQRTFFPTFRRASFPRDFCRDVQRTNELVSKLTNLFTSPDFQSTYQFVRPAAAAVLALPLLNADLRQLTSEIVSLYELQIFQPRPALSKHVVRRSGGRGLRIRNLDFVGTVNKENHPVRRCTDSVLCDLAALLRLGFSLPPRFEFDVSCEAGIAGKTFRLCDGSSQQIPKGTTHLNMRINDDFKCANG